MNIYTSLGSGDLFSPWMFEILMQLSFGVYVPQTDLQLLGSGYFSFLALKHGSHLATLYLFLKLCTIVLVDIQFFFYFVCGDKSLYLSPDQHSFKWQQVHWNTEGPELPSQVIATLVFVNLDHHLQYTTPVDYPSLASGYAWWSFQYQLVTVQKLGFLCTTQMLLFLVLSMEKQRFIPSSFPQHVPQYYTLYYSL